jgi:hypothetical protein
MSGPYPFPLPESIREEFEKKNSPELIRDALDGALPVENEPFHPSFLFWWHTRTYAFFLAVENTWAHLAEIAGPVYSDKSYDLNNTMWATISALKQELDRLERLLPFFKHTWPHDPVIKAYFQGNGDKAAAETEASA